jgi:uncharacterized protein YndB with AHSA1/START domain
MELTVKVTVNVPAQKCWQLWTTPANIMQWNNAFEDWHTPRVTLDLQDGGSFFYRMETKDGSVGFDFSGKYDKVIPNEIIEFTTHDGRKGINKFVANGGQTEVMEIFEPEAATPVDEQRDFCQKILNNFKKYAESIAG